MSDLILLCEMCGFPVTGESGGLFVRLAVVTEALRGHDAIRWESAHDACRVYPEDDRYEITADRIGTWPDLARWTAHLMEKGWLALSDWDQVLREAAGETPLPGDRQRIRAIAREAA